MAKRLVWLADAAAVVGVGLCMLAGLVRLAGHYWIGNMDAMTVFVGGVGLMVFACLVNLRVSRGCGGCRPSGEQAGEKQGCCK